MKIDVPAHTVNVGGYGANQLTASGYLGGGRHGGPITLDVTGTINIPEFTSKTLGDSNTGVTWDLNNTYMTYFDVPAFKGPDAPDKVKRPGPPPVATPTAVVPLPPEIDC